GLWPGLARRGVGPPTCARPPGTTPPDGGLVEPRFPPIPPHGDSRYDAGPARTTSRNGGVVLRGCLRFVGRTSRSASSRPPQEYYGCRFPGPRRPGWADTEFFMEVNDREHESTSSRTWPGGPSWPRGRR